MRTISVLLASGVLAAAGATAFEPNGIVVFMSDFGTSDDAAALCKGVMVSVDPTLKILDLTHEVTPFDVREGAIYLAEAAKVYPSGTVFIGVVDPGVGTSRRAIVLETEDGLAFVGPDNGLFTLVEREHGTRGAWEITSRDFMRPNPSATFHGRDLFAPTAALLASGAARPNEAGGPAGEIIRLRLSTPAVRGESIEGEVLLLDKAFGNVWTNVPRRVFQGAFGDTVAGVRLSFRDTTLDLPIVSAFGDVPAGEPLAYFNSRDHLSFAVNLGSFAERFGLFPGAAFAISIATEPARPRNPAE